MIQVYMCYPCFPVQMDISIHPSSGARVCEAMFDSEPEGSSVVQQQRLTHFSRLVYQHSLVTTRGELTNTETSHG